MPVAPKLKRRPTVVSRRMALDFIGRPVDDIGPPAVGLPAWNPSCPVPIALIGISDAAVVLFLVLIFDCIRCRIPAQPELFYEMFALFIGLEPFESEPFAVGGSYATSSKSS